MGYRTTKSKIKAGSNKAKTFDPINATANISYTAFFYHTFRNVLIISIPLVIISAIILSSLHISATDSTSSTDTLSFNISSSCTLSSVVDSSHTAELINGTYTNSIGQTTITTLCNDGNGYSVYAVGYSNNEEGNNKLVNTENSNFNIISGTATSGTTSNRAMSLNNLVDDPSLTPPVITSGYDGIYGIVPNEWTKVASLPARATDMIKGSSFTTTYAVYTSSSQYAGTYNGRVKYLLTHPSTTDNQLFMQNVETIKNLLSNAGDSMQVIDQRDGKKYWVTRLADGNVWMTQNLDFDINSNTMLNSTTTDLNVIYNSSTNKYAEYNNGYTESNGIIYWAPLSAAGTIDFEGTTVPDWQNSDTVPHSANKTDSTETGHASLGNYYNWTAAIASNNSSSLAQSTLSNTTNSPKNSICPKGWRLPTIPNQSASDTGSTNEFARLEYLYNINYTNVSAPPLYFIKSGYILDSSIEGQINIKGFYWSSTLKSYDSAYDFAFNQSAIFTDDASFRRRGFAVRCVAW